MSPVWVSSAPKTPVVALTVKDFALGRRDVPLNYVIPDNSETPEYRFVSVGTILQDVWNTLVLELCTGSSAENKLHTQPSS